MPPKNNLVGQKFGRLTVIEDSGKLNKNGDVLWTCTCLCGAEKRAVAFNLRLGITRSCGCLQKESRFRHGFNRRGKASRLYIIWMNIRSRCLNRKSPSYRYYGERGISICEVWQRSFLAFKSWALSHGYQMNLCIDRINNKGNYEPSNCQWITPSENSRKAHQERRA